MWDGGLRIKKDRTQEIGVEDDHFDRDSNRKVQNGSKLRRQMDSSKKGAIRNSQAHISKISFRAGHKEKDGKLAPMPH